MNSHVTGDEHQQLLCPSHRARMEKDLAYAEQRWIGLNKAALKKSDAEQWDQALVVFGHVFEIAEILLSHSDPRSTSQPRLLTVNRYLNSALNLCYVLRKCERPANIDLLLAVVKDKLEQYVKATETELLLKPLTTMAYRPNEELRRPITFVNPGNTQVFNIAQLTLSSPSQS